MGGGGRWEVDMCACKLRRYTPLIRGVVWFEASTEGFSEFRHSHLPSNPSGHRASLKPQDAN